jgi:hypothetical protein
VVLCHCHTSANRSSEQLPQDEHDNTNFNPIE